MNIILCSHCDFNGNSAMHVYSVARELNRIGHECVIALPGDITTTPVDSDVPILSYADVANEGGVFSNGAGANLVHAWTPRAHVAAITRELCARFSCPYVVHMEDNEEQIVRDEIGGAWPFELLRGSPPDLVDRVVANPFRTNVSVGEPFLADAVGYTCLVNNLLEFAPPETPTCVFSPGFDPMFADHRDRRACREALGLDPDAAVVTYCGNVHLSNVDEVRSLYAGLALIGRRGRRPLVLLRTGWDQAPLGIEGAVGLELINLGFVSRDQLPTIVSAADVLVQPGRVNDFNRCRFPSKIPEYLASGRPVVLPDCNIGAELKDHGNAVKLSTSDAFEIAEKVEYLLAHPKIADRIGEAGRAFALERLTWPLAAERLSEFYGQVLRNHSRSSPRAASPPTRFPLTLLSTLDENAEDPLAITRGLADAGVQAVAIRIGADARPRAAWAEPYRRDFKFAAMVCASDLEADGGAKLDRIRSELNDEQYLRVDGRPLILTVGTLGVEGGARLQEWRRSLTVEPVFLSCDRREWWPTSKAVAPPSVVFGEDGSADYILTAISALEHSSEAAAPVVFAPTKPFSAASVRAYARWLKSTVVRRIDFTRPHDVVVIDGLGSVAASAANGQPRALAILAATREALIQGLVDAARPPGQRPDEEFRQRTSYRVNSET